MLDASPSETAARPLRVLAAGAVKSVMEDLFDAGRTEAGAAVEAIFDTVGALRDRVLGGDRPDILILSTPAIDALAAGGRIEPGPVLNLGRTGVALAGPKDSPTVAIDTPEGFRQVLLDVPSIGYAEPGRGATAGTQFVKCLERLGLTDLLREKLKVFPFRVDAITAVGRGEIAVGVSQATEVLPRTEVAFLGFFPEPLQVWTSYRAAALSDDPAAMGLMDALASPKGIAALRRAGFH